MFISKPEVREAIKKILDMNYKQLLEYRRVGMIMPQKISESVTSREKLIELLRAEKVSEFNALRVREGLEEIDLSGANLRGANLRGANLRGANLREADLREADLREADLREADLSEADLREADLREADLREADLREAYLSGADLRGADLSGADLRGADLREANLREANLREADLRGADLRGADLRGADLRRGIISIRKLYYQEVKVSAANFADTLINDSGFLEYLRENGAKNVPDEVSTKDEFINEMEKRGLDVGGIEQFFDE